MGQRAEQFVTGRVAKAVVDVLEVIEVEEQHGNPCVVALSMQQRMLETFMGQQAVGQLGQRIEVCHVGQPFLAVLEGADVAEDQYILAFLACAAANQTGVEQHRQQATVGVAAEQFALPLAVVAQGAPQLAVALALFGIVQGQRQVTAERGFRRQAGQLTERRVAGDDAALLVDDEDGLAAAVEDRGRLAQRGFVLLAHADVFKHRDEVMRLAVGMAYQCYAEMRPDQSSTGMPVTLFQAVAVPFALQQPLHFMQVAWQVIGMAELLEGALQQLLLGIAEHLAEMAVDAQPLAIQGNMGNADGGVLEGCPETLFAFLALLLEHLLLHCQGGQAAEFGHQVEVFLAGLATLLVVDAENPEHLLEFVLERQ